MFLLADFLVFLTATLDDSPVLREPEMSIDWLVDWVVSPLLGWPVPWPVPSLVDSMAASLLAWPLPWPAPSLVDSMVATLLAWPLPWPVPLLVDSMIASLDGLSVGFAGSSLAAIFGGGGRYNSDLFWNCMKSRSASYGGKLWRSR